MSLQQKNAALHRECYQLRQKLEEQDINCKFLQFFITVLLVKTKLSNAQETNIKLMEGIHQMKSKFSLQVLECKQSSSSFQN